jgi:hypothetical protein
MMRAVAFTGFVFSLSSAPILAQGVIPNPPPNIVDYLSCAAFPVLPLDIRITYVLHNIRPNGGDGRWQLWYRAHHQNETESGNSNDRYIANSVDVNEEYSDMGDWVMRENWGKRRWHGECVRTANGANWVYGIDIYGNLARLPAEDCDYQILDPLGYSDCLNLGSGGPGGGPGDPPPPGGEALCDFFNIPSGCYDVYIDGMYVGKICC